MAKGRKGILLRKGLCRSALPIHAAKPAAAPEAKAATLPDERCGTIAECRARAAVMALCTAGQLIGRGALRAPAWFAGRKGRALPCAECRTLEVNALRGKGKILP